MHVAMQAFHLNNNLKSKLRTVYGSVDFDTWEGKICEIFVEKISMLNINTCMGYFNYVQLIKV